MGPKKKKKNCQRQTLKTFIMGCLLQSASNASQPVLALSMRLTGRAWLNCEASASAKRAEIWNPTGATHNHCLQFDRKDMGVRQIWKQKQKWSAKREHGTDVRLCDGDEDRSPLVNSFMLKNLYPTNSRGRKTSADLVGQAQLWTTAEKLSRSAGLKLHEICLFQIQEIQKADSDPSGHCPKKPRHKIHKQSFDMQVSSPWKNHRCKVEE